MSHLGTEDITEFLTTLKDTKAELTKTFQVDLNKYLRSDRKFHMEFKINQLSLPLKKHVLVTGIMQGVIFQYADCFSYVTKKSSMTLQPSAENSLYLYIVGPSALALLSAIGMLEKYVEDVKDHFEINKRRKSRFQPAEIRPTRKSWKSVFPKEIDLKDYPYSAINNVLTKGVLEGEIFIRSGAIVSVKGDPYLADSNLTTRPLFLLIEAPTRHALSLAVLKVEDLLKDAISSPITGSPRTPYSTNNPPQPSSATPGNNEQVQHNPLTTKPATLARTQQPPHILQPTRLPTMQQPSPILQPASLPMVHQPPPILQPAAGPMAHQPSQTVQPATIPTTQQTPSILQPTRLPTMQQPPPILQPASLPMMHQPPPILQPAAGQMTQQPSQTMQPASLPMMQEPVCNPLTDSQSTESSQEHLLSDVIQQLQQYLQANGPTT